MENLVNNSDIFAGAYKGKRVLVTGHTGFKGSWLCLWLLRLGAKVAGFSLYLPSQPCNFEAINLKEKISHYQGDVRNIEELQKAVEDFKPQIIFHLAAQPIVRKSYDEPKLTFDTNLGGTVNILECVKNYAFVQAAVIITSDKCYENVEWEWGYRESDRLGGADPYSASKACAEIAFNAYTKSYFDNNNIGRIATVRAGNVIGGGDWGMDRIVPDCVRAWTKKESPVIRNPEATRPWQHVLEPLSGYLWLGANLLNEEENLGGESFNFGPSSDVLKSVQQLVDLFLQFWGEGDWEHIPDNQKKESTLLKLCCDKSLHRLGWQPVLTFEETVKLTAEWYKNYYNNFDKMYNFACSQIDYYITKASQKNLPWAMGKETKSTKYLIFGKKGWLAQKFNDFFNSESQGFRTRNNAELKKIAEQRGRNVVSEISEVDVTDLDAIRKELDEKKPEVVINATGKTGRPNVDWCEEYDTETIISNVIGTRKIHIACSEREIYWVHLSSGCIFQGEGPDGRGFREQDNDKATPPSWYSWTKYWADQFLMDKPVLIVRFRLPIDSQPNPRNLIDKLIKHPKVRNINNSITVIPDLLDAVKKLIEKKRIGVYHIVNPGTINSSEIMEAYKNIVNPVHQFGVISEEDYYDKVAVVRRADCILNTDKLQQEGIYLKPIKERIVEVMQEYKKNLKNWKFDKKI